MSVYPRVPRITDRAVRSYFTGRLVVITGGSSGIGYAVAERLAACGARLILVANDETRLAEARQRLEGRGSEVAAVVCDLADRAATRAAMRSLVERYGAPDVLINNAGFAVYRTFAQSPVDEIDDLIEVNFAAHLRCTRLLLDSMVSQGRGQIINVASIAGLMTITPNAVYCASKSGVVAWSRALRVELAQLGLGVSVVCPGRVVTAFFDHESFQQRKHRRETELTVPMSRVVDAILGAGIHNRELVVVPAYLKWVALLTMSVWPVRRVYRTLLRRRIDDFHGQ
jgi:short-subunit dehydrogenase